MALAKSYKFGLWWVGRRGIMDNTLGSGDRVRGFPVTLKCFFSGLFSSSFFFLHHVTSLSHNACWPVNSGFTTVYGGGKKRINKEKSQQRHLWRRNSEVSAMYGKGA